MGALDSLHVRPRVLSYEGPFGVGYMVAAVDILEDDDGRTFAEAEPARAEPAEAAPQDIVAAAGPNRFGVVVQNGRGRGLLLPDIEGADNAEQQVAIARSKAIIEPHEPVSLWRFDVRRLA